MGEDALVVDTSFAQQSLWLQNELDPGQPAYNVTAAVRLRGPLDLEGLRRALNTVVERHEVLRTVFDLDDGDPVQVIVEPGPLTVPVLDAAPDTWEAMARAELETPFDLREGPLIRLTLLRLAPDHHVALLVMHHIVTDGVSSAILFRELTAAYGAHCAGHAVALPELPIQYADFAVWQRDHLRGEELRRLTGHWSAALAGARPLDLPSDRPRPETPGDRGGAHHFDLPPALVARLEALGRRHNASPFMVLLAAFDVLLTRVCGQEDITVTAPMSGRTRPELEGLVGYFVNPLMLRVDTSADPSFAELLERVRTTCLEAFKHQELPFEQAVELMRRQDPRSRAAAAQVMMVLQAKAPARWRAAGLTFEMAEVDTGTSKADLILDVRPGDSGHHVLLQYRTDLFDPGTAARLAESYVAVLEGVVDRPDERISRLPLLSADERRRILDRWSTGTQPAGGPAGGLVHDAVAHWAATAPDAVAVESATGRICYRELDLRAEKLAGALRASGVGPGSVVALTRTEPAALAVAALATLRAGGCCFPLDPSLPDRILGDLLRVSGAALLLDDAEPPATAAPATRSDAGFAVLNWTATATGGPMTAALTHEAVLSAAAATATTLGLRPGGRWAPSPAGPEDPPLPPEHVLRLLLPVLLFGATLDFGAGPAETGEAAGLAVHGALPETAGGVSAGDAGDHGPSTALPGHTLYVLDEHLEPVLPGVTGELCLAGPALSAGFRGRPGETAARFVPDPHGSRPGGRLLRTGERARHLPDGGVVLLGRADGLLTRCGRRVDPAEAEPVLAGRPGVADCAVVARTLPSGGTVPVAYAVAEPGAVLDPDGLLRDLHTRLPGPWRPVAVVEVGSIPRTPGGAPDTGALPLPDEGPGTAAYTAPRTPLEQETARIWEELLGVGPIGVHDNFFDLGGQSLTAVRLAARLREEFGVRIAVRALYADFTVAEVAWKVLRLMVGEDQHDGPTVRAPHHGPATADGGPAASHGGPAERPAQPFPAR